jgi:serine/threonine protein kinase
MTPEPHPPASNPLGSEFQTRHPQIADEIEGAIRTLHKLKEIATPAGGAPPTPDQGESALATIAMSQTLQGPAPGAGAMNTGAFTSTEAGPSGSDELAVLPASSTFGRYQIVRMLGRGAMGAVYLAYDTELHRHVAIKTPSLGKSTLTIERFYREARSAAQLRSPYLCPVYDVGKVGDIHYISMAFIDGVPLTKVMARQKFKSVDEIIAIVSKIARGLQKAHESEIVHRDLKPDNIMIEPDGEPIVLDFGLARRVNDDVQVTLPGVIVGTPAYMSPEQVDGDPAKIGPATDIYSLGIILYQLLTGQLPFRGSLTSILQQIASQQPVKPSSCNYTIAQDSPLEQICMKMVAKSPSDRFASMAEVVAALDSLTGKAAESTVVPRSRLGRIKSWSSGVFANISRSSIAQTPTSETSPKSITDLNSPTLIDPP